MKILFDDADMDAQLSRTLTAVAAEACDLGEAFATAARVIEGDYDSWYSEWSATAQAAQTLADRSAEGGHAVTARKAYLRASEYWRQAFFFLRHDITDERLQHAWHQHRLTFRSALPYLEFPSVATEIPFNGATMSGYLFRVSDDGAPRPTVIAPCGYDSTAEAGYCATGYMALARGYNFFVFEGPGQGGMLYEHRVAMRPDFEVPFAAAFNWLIDQPGVDPDRVAIIGRSFGGYLGPRAAAFEPRIAALVADPGQFDFASRIAKMVGTTEHLQKIIDADPDVDAQLEALYNGPRNTEWYGSRMATLGAATVGDWIRRQLTYELGDCVGSIACPTLITEGEGDFAAQGETLYNHLQPAIRKELKRFSEAEGAGGHCEGLGATLFEGYAFDWLDDVLGRR
ncbi:alpha/beta hydrolase family protein [Mycolicibacterium psychrotolerans]|uniref:alpha/beta hydrolase family protein n=1 Tax=Mycolicibacterium psychrotolerans TaxID=216929 RepID=UPI003D675BF6